MMEAVPGKLVWQSTKKRGKERRVVHQTRKGGMSQPTTFNPHQISPSLKDRLGEDTDVDVEVVLDGGQIVAVRAPGEDWTAPAPPPSAASGAGRGTGGRRSQPASRHGGSEAEATPSGAFRNPYNFIPAVPPAAEGPLSQHAPLGHDRYRKGHWSGRIHIEIVAETPLLIPDTANATEATEDTNRKKKGHKTFDIRTDAASRPLLPPTSLKGALRSAYEAVTNSRTGVFAGHGDKLAYRMPAEEGLAMVPARVVRRAECIELSLFFGTHEAPAWPELDEQGRLRPPKNEMYAAWLPRYRPRHRGDRSNWQTQEDKDHKSKAVCIVQRMTHYSQNNRGRQFSFSYWEVADWKPFDAGYDALDGDARCRTYDSRNDRGVGSWTVAHDDHGDIQCGWGYICATNQNIGNKHDERVFFVKRGANPYPFPVNSKFADDWRALVKNYQAQHRDAISKRRRNERRADRKDPWVYLGRDPGKTAWSRHVYAAGTEKLEAEALCYARADQHGDIHGLYPVMISRELYEVAPDTLLLDELLPARKCSGTDHKERLEQLSPADRVFGWANQHGGGAWRGQLRIGPVACKTEVDKAIERFDGDGLPLAILSAPKPQQARFYVAKDKDGTPQEGGLSKDDAAYKEGKGLRGRKVYPHHRSANAVDGYWSREDALQDAEHDIPSGEEDNRPDRIEGDGFREYVRRRGHEFTRRGERKELPNRDDQNRSIKAWVNPGTRFTAWIDIINLSEAELGALLWLLSLNAFESTNTGLFHRLGGGKPLGFGSVKIAITGLDLADGEGKAEEYSTLLPISDEAKSDKHFACAHGPDEAKDAALRFVRRFKESVETAYPRHGGRKGFAQISFVEAFLQAARGYDDDRPTHYPRNSRAPDPAGKTYEWFVSNEKTGRDAPPNNQHALGPLAGDPGLPYWPRSDQGPPQRGRPPRKGGSGHARGGSRRGRSGGR